LGCVDQLVDLCKQNPVDEVIFCLPRESFFQAEQHVLDLEELGITSRMVLHLCEDSRSRRELSFFHHEVPILTFHSKSLDAQQLFLKRLLDVAGAVVGLVLTLLLLPFVALAIKLDSRGPVFFSQERIGLNGRIFKCWKFRSMYIDAEARKAELLHHNEMKGSIFKISDDPRVTRVGKLLRKSSLDEFPQFWNVFRGEMSLVGTRPPTPDEVAGYENWQRRRISIKPGITGLWQVSGRNQISDFDEIVKLDIEYIERWSLWLDAKILLKTIWVVFVGRGAR
jgi:exopolysaccharide biosynthesis polyprenyl glycosylphosphotransferase